MMIAGLECDVRCHSPGRFTQITQGGDFSMRAAGLSVPPGTSDATLISYDAADPGIWVGSKHAFPR